MNDRLMESVFLLEDEERSFFLQRIVQSFRCSYICLWSYLTHPTTSNCLICMDGFYNIQEQSVNSLAYAAFNEYRKSMFVIDQENHQHVPGLAFKNELPYLELKELDLQRLASNQTQLYFYQTVMFMGCRKGEIELGMHTQTQALVNLEMEMKNWFPSDLFPSSSSSSLRSLSMDSPDINIPVGEEPKLNIAAPRQNPLQLSYNSSPAAIIRPLQYPGPETEHTAITEAILAVLSFPSSSSSSSSSLALSYGQLPTHHQISSRRKASPSAFKCYRLKNLTNSTSGRQQQDMLKRSINICRTLNLARIQEQVLHAGRAPTNSQLQHMISERKRRDKLNQSFQTLKSLLPHAAKKDKTSILSTTIEHIALLKSQLSDLTRSNQDLMAKLVDKPQSTSDEISILTNHERVDVRISHIATSTSHARVVDLHVLFRGNISLMDAVICLLEFLKRVRNVNLTSLNTKILTVESQHISTITMRLNISDEDGEWDEGSFQEAVKRLVSDLAQ
ncbi:putative transcription factor bHLH041 [Impatiens glandulifera]|uniref:putative transcription factor bHLH041 n=1 Tax=Impatiens glandulifera TaxID=253017 RepID=UPI001FB1471F|nr:putative transcription factor bHLH041 [Impatiens glandulifera]